MAAVRALVVDVGGRLGRSAQDVGPFAEVLKENWYDSVESIGEASADDLAALGLPRRFAVELIQAAGEGGARGSKMPSREKGKGKSKDAKGKGKGKAKSSGKASAKGGELRHTIPIDVSGIDTDFIFRPKLIGPKGANVHHIEDQTGVRVELVGSDDDGYLEFVLVGNDDRLVDKAAGMCEDLIETVFEDFSVYQRERGQGGKGRRDDKGKGKGKGKGKEKGKKGKNRGAREGELEERVPIDAAGVDPEFGLRAKLVGLEGRNVHHIERSSGARVSVEHDDGEGMAFCIFAKDPAHIESAKSLCMDLLDTVLKEAGVVVKRRPQTDTAGGKGKGRRKGKDDDRPTKVQRTM